jgi:Mn2+/Fe2+ NRAMP family transporter
VLYGVVASLLIANTLNIAANVAAMGEAAALVTGVDRHSMTVLFVFVTLLLQVFVPYHRYVFVLKWLTLSLLAYAADLFTVHVLWGQVALRTVWPRFRLDAVFWQPSEEVEDMRAKRATPLRSDPDSDVTELRRIRWDT